jgi:predicted ABC-type sugar transport system permease subunit
VSVVEVHVEAAYLLTPSHTVQGSDVNCAGFGQKLLAGQFWQIVLEVVVHVARVYIPRAHGVHPSQVYALVVVEYVDPETHA